MNYLTKSEDILLLAIHHLKNNAYGVTIRKQVKQLTGEEMTYGTLYSSLDQLVRKDYVDKIEGEPTPERGGRRKIYYSITPKGFEALKKSQQLTKNLWQAVSELSFEENN